MARPVESLTRAATIPAHLAACAALGRHKLAAWHGTFTGLTHPLGEAAARLEFYCSSTIAKIAPPPLKRWHRRRASSLHWRRRMQSCNRPT
eukprot:SAG11_NODE_1939_length_4028_cov_1.658946_4_plen_91_part_00